jgi:predicted transcriptional regulator of viral defense system
VLCFPSAYLGLQDALSFHNLWEQETLPIVITSANVRAGIRKVMDQNILIRKIDKKYFFGFDYYQNEDVALPYSNIEKTFIDLIYFKESLSEEALKNIQINIDKNKLKNYLKKYPKKFRLKVLSYLKNN